ncbi:MAG: bifunctional diaminohydroxyphosphoribosylaminopyrimidine deaminase/5-amino-6-(5-phosphoribosylamino)uracil reductase RibD [Alphaproteobacteria bacterium]
MTFSASSDDQHYMKVALSLARRGLGRCAPNPSVGCVIVQDNRIVGMGRTADGGRPHAETEALRQAGERAQGADIYVTLEPCSHHGKTAPCAEALIKAQVKRVIIGCIDPNPQVSGGGVDMLKSAGIEVVTGVLVRDCALVNAGFCLTQTQNRPFVTLKTAMSLDGKTALNSGESQWITGALARRKAHQLRAQHDAIMVGVNTVTHDDPMLTTRVDGLVHKPVRIVVDKNLRLPIGSKLVQNRVNDPLWIVYASAETGQIEALIAKGAVLLHVPSMQIADILKALAERGITRLLVEGGARLHSAFLDSGLYDELAVFRSADILGAGLGAFDKFEAQSLDQRLQFRLKQTIVLGKDRLDLFAKSDAKSNEG